MFNKVRETISKLLDSDIIRGINKKEVNKIAYNTRYSDTDKLDKFGRWARTASYNGIRIAWISKIEQEGKEYYSVSLHFPTLNNDTATEHKVFLTLQEAKEFVSERWNWFLNAVS